MLEFEIYAPLSNSMKLSGDLNKRNVNCVFYQLENFTHDLTLGYIWYTIRAHRVIFYFWKIYL